MKICKSLDCAQENEIDNAAEVVGPYTINKLEQVTINDKVLCIKLYQYDESDLDQARVTIFGRHNYALPYAGTFVVGDYNLDDLKANHIDAPGTTNSAKSMRIPAGLSVYLYKNDHQVGDSILINGPKTIDFSKEHTDYDGNISSIKIIKTADFSISGSWSYLGSGLSYETKGFQDKSLDTNNAQFDQEYLEAFL